MTADEPVEGRRAAQDEGWVEGYDPTCGGRETCNPDPSPSVPVESRPSDAELIAKAASALHVALGYATHSLHASVAVEQAELDGCFIVLDWLRDRTNP